MPENTDTGWTDESRTILKMVMNVVQKAMGTDLDPDELAEGTRTYLKTPAGKSVLAETAQEYLQTLEGRAVIDEEIKQAVVCGVGEELKPQPVTANPDPLSVATAVKAYLNTPEGLAVLAASMRSFFTSPSELAGPAHEPKPVPTPTSNGATGFGRSLFNRTQ